SGTVEFGPGGGKDRVARSAGSGSGQQRTGERERDLALVGREIPVAAGDREPVRFADRGHGDDPYRYIEIGHHRPDQGQLLVILLAEEREIGPGQMEELEHHGKDAVEVARAMGSFEDRPEWTRVDPYRRLAVGVHLRGRGSEHHIDPASAA